MTDPDNQIFAIDEESGWLETRAFSPGIMMIFANYVAAIMATVGEYRRLATLENDNPVTVWNMTPAARAKAYKTIQSGAVQAILLYGVLLGVSAPLVTLTARPLDPRMVYIIHGISRTVAAVILAIMSVRIAKWLGLYASYRPVAHYYEKQRRQLMGTTVLELRHAVRWSVAKKLLRTYCVLLFLLQQAADEEDKGHIAIPFSIVAGLVTGLAVDWLAYKIRRFERERRKKYLSIALAVFLSGLSAYALGVAAFFIAYVWDDSEEALKDLEDSIWPLWAFGSGLIIMFLTHLFVWHWSKHISATMVNNSVHSSTTTYKQRMAWSMVLSNAKLSDVIKKSTQDNPTVAETQKIQSVMAGKMDDILEEEEMEDQGLYSENRDPSFSGQMEPSVEDAENHGSLLETEPDKELEGEEQAVITVDPLYDDPVPNDTLKTTEESSLSSPRPPTRKELFMKWQCCGCVRGKDKSTGRKVYGCCSWTLYLMACFVCVFAVIVNIGASHQQEAARAKLPYVFEKLYRYMDEGPVCAFDNRGADSNITTFPDRDAAHAAGFLILHCGACAACSDWENLELEYTTRNFLALESRKCAQKTLFGGGHDDLVECLEGDQIGFQGQCAVCWADDILCTKSFCAFIAIQSFLINTLSNFEVGNDTITSAACEEAHCEAGNPGDFVYCSGATRRRMNVTSSIKRPGAQQCSIVDVDWEELFPDPHPNARL